MKKQKFKMPVAAAVALSFLIVIVVGAGLLCLPFSVRGGKIDVVAAFFTATSAVSGTGLTVVDTYNHWSTFGQVIVLILMQIGGLGFITLVSPLIFSLNKHTTLSQRKLFMWSAGGTSLNGLKSLVKYIALGTIAFELIGAFLLCFSFIPNMGWGMGIWQALFTSVSAFCNAGLSLTGRFAQDSLVAYVADPLLIITLSVLIIVGGIGFFVWYDVVKNGLHVGRYSLQSKIVLTTSMILMFGGWLLFAIFEWNNGATIGNETVGTKLLASWFMSISPRNAGFNTINVAEMSEASTSLTVVYMLIGGGPASTAGGLKTTTLAVFILSTIATSKRYPETHVFKRKLEDDTFAYSSVVVGIYIAIVTVCVIATLAIEQGHSNINSADAVFMFVSAISTSGLSVMNCSDLTVFTQILIILVMFVGRVGGYTLILIFASDQKPVTISRVTEKLIIG